MAATKTLISADEFFALGGSAKQELVAGEVIEMVPPGGEHGGLQGVLIFHLQLCVESSGTGVVLGEAGFRLKVGPDTVRAPDVAYLSAARLPEGPLPRTYIVGAPDIAVEIVSPNDTATDVQEKVQEYLDAGSLRVWVVDPARASITVHYPNGTSRTLRGDDVLSGEDVLPGFSLRVADLFSRSLRRQRPGQSASAGPRAGPLRGRPSE